MYGPELPIIICSLVSIYNIFGLIFLYHIIWVYMGPSILSMSLYVSHLYYLRVYMGLLYIIYEYMWVSSILSMSIYVSPLYYLWVYMGLLYIIYEYMWVSSILSMSIYGSPLITYEYMWVSSHCKVFCRFSFSSTK